MHTEREMEQICRFTRKVFPVGVRSEGGREEGRREARREEAAQPKERRQRGSRRRKQLGKRRKSFTGKSKKKIECFLKRGADKWKG